MNSGSGERDEDSPGSKSQKTSAEHVRHEFWTMIHFSVYAGFFVAGIAPLFAVCAFPSKVTLLSHDFWHLLLALLGCFAFGFLTMLCALLDFVGFKQKWMI